MSLKNLICELEDEFKVRENSLENEVKNLMIRLEKSQDEYLNLKLTNEKRLSLLEEDIHEKDTFIKQLSSIKAQQQQQQLYKQHQNPLLTYKPSNLIKDFDVLNSNLNSNFKSNSILKQPVNKQLIDEQQQKIKDILQNTILNKQNAFEQSKLQQIQNINTLKSKLHDVELLSGSFSTSIKNF